MGLDLQIGNVSTFTVIFFGYVAKSIGSLKRLKDPNPRYGPSPFSLICSLQDKLQALVIKNQNFNFLGYISFMSCVNFMLS